MPVMNVTNGIDEIAQIIDEIAKCIKNGDEIVYDALPKELQWRWTNTRSSMLWLIHIRHVKLASQNAGKPIMEVIHGFIQNEIDAVEAQKQISKLNKLKVFW